MHLYVYNIICYTPVDPPSVHLKQCCSTSHPKKDFCQVWQSCLLEHIKPFLSCGRVDQLLILGMVIPPLMGNTYTWYINPYYKVDDHAYRGCLEVWHSSCGS